MEVVEEEAAQIAKRQTIQAIMRDTSLAPQEKQRKIQEFMASGGQASAPAPAPSPAPSADSSLPAQAQPESNGGGNGGSGQDAKRQAIQVIMRDTSLTPQEKQKKVQEFMASGGKSAPPAAPTPQSSPPQNSGSQPTNSRQSLMQAVMRDSSLNAQEKQKKIQEIMADTQSTPTAAEPRAGGTAAPEATPQTAASTSSFRQSLMQEVMKDATLSPQEKQQRIQDILKNNSAGTAAAAPAASEPAPVVSEPPAPSPASNSRVAMQQVMRDSSLTPQEKQQRIQKIMASGAAAAPAAAAATPAPEPNAAARQPGVGAVPSIGADPATRKGARRSVTVAPMEAAASVREPGQDGGGAAARPASLGAVSSSGIDPATRKSAPAFSAPGASAARRTSDAATRKAQRGVYSRTLNSDASGAAPGSGAASSDASLRTDDPAAFAAATMTAAAREDQPSEDTNGLDPGQIGIRSQREAQEISQVRDLEPNGLEKMRPQPLAERYDEEMAGAIAAVGSSDRGMAPVEEENSNHADLLNARGMAPGEEGNSNHANLLNAPRARPEDPASADVDYAGLSYTPDIAGADTGGFQAYVAGQTEDVVQAAGVVTEAAIEEEDKRKQSRYLRIGMAVFCILLVAIVVPVAVLVPGNGDDQFVGNVTEIPSQAPSSPPTSSTFADLLSTLKILYADDEAYEKAFSDYGTPQFQAASWAADEDSQELSGSDPRMISRYALATFYFSTNGDDWTRCGRGSTNCDEGREWLTASDECDWLAIECTDSVNHSVKDIFFRPTSNVGNNIAGTLPFDLVFLSNLNRVILSRQELKGSIPESWSRLSNLETLIMGGNELTGTFPGFLLQENPMLATIYFSNNKFSGELPSELTSAALEDLRLDYNQITGAIPPGISDLPGLKTLHLDNNKLNGTIPEELYALSNLRSISLSNNTGLSGTISEGIVNLSSLMQLRLINTGLGGMLPSGLFDLIDLTALELSDCSFAGTLSESFAQLAKITQIRLNNNTFTGSIPMAFATLEYLRTLELHSNDLTGTVSDSLCNRTGDGFDYISDLTVDCLEVSCDCCDCFPN